MDPVVDAESGLIYLRARYYDPATGQFLTRDPLVALTGEAYGYVGDNPLNESDQSGLDPCYSLGQGIAGPVPDNCQSRFVGYSSSNLVTFSATTSGGSGELSVDITNLSLFDWQFRVAQTNLANAISTPTTVLLAPGQTGTARLLRGLSDFYNAEGCPMNQFDVKISDTLGPLSLYLFGAGGVDFGDLGTPYPLYGISIHWQTTGTL